MYGHPHKKDPYAERQAIPDYEFDGPDDAPSGFLIVCLVVAMPVFATAFTLGYFSGAWGWF